MESLRNTAQQMRAEGMTCRQIAEELGMSDSWVHKWTPKQGRSWKQWTKADEAKLHKLIADGKSGEYIAEKLGRTPNSIRLKWMRMPHEKQSSENVMRTGLEELIFSMRAVELGCEPKRAVRAVRKADIVGRY